MKYSIAIDGPAASGKSKTADVISKILGFERVDSGLLYRAVTYLIFQKFIDENLNFENEEVKNFILSLSIKQENGKIFYQNEEITNHLRTHFIDSKVGVVAKQYFIREKIHQIQKDLIKYVKNGVIIDGRDIGTVVLPDAFLKIFITAKDTVRAKRRAAQTGENYEKVLEELKRRDNADLTREHGPLKVADDAIVIENDNLDLDETVNLVLSHFNDRKNLE